MDLGGGEDKEAGGGRGACFGNLRVSERGNYLHHLGSIKSGPWPAGKSRDGFLRHRNLPPDASLFRKE